MAEADKFQAQLHVIAFAESYAAAPTSYDAMDAVSDGVFSRASATGLYVPAGMKLVAAFGSFGVYPNPRFRINAPSMLKVGYPQILPLAQQPGSDDPNFQVLLDRPILFPSNEVVGVDAVAATSAAVQAGHALLFFAKEIAPLPPGDAFWIRGSASTATTPGSWSGLDLTWDVTLPEGTWAIIGFSHVCSNGVAARLVFPGSSYRPGTLTVGSTVQRTHAAFLEGKFGVFGQFAAFAPPSVEALTASAATDHQVFIRVVRVA